jgi:hypothetical protein
MVFGDLAKALSLAAVALDSGMVDLQRPFHGFLAPYLRGATYPLHPPPRTQRGRRLPRRLLINNTLSFFQHKS